jgi:hypothetical protein
MLIDRLEEEHEGKRTKYKKIITTEVIETI